MTSMAIFLLGTNHTDREGPGGGAYEGSDFQCERSDIGKE